TVRRPARVSQAVVGDGAVRAGRRLEVRQVADRADIVEPTVLAQRDPGRVVAAVLEALEAAQQQVLRGPATDIPDDPAHPKLLSEERRVGKECRSRRPTYH